MSIPRQTLGNYILRITKRDPVFGFLRKADNRNWIDTGDTGLRFYLGLAAPGRVIDFNRLTATDRNGTPLDLDLQRCDRPPDGLPGWPQLAAQHKAFFDVQLTLPPAGTTAGPLGHWPVTLYLDTDNPASGSATPIVDLDPGIAVPLFLYEAVHLWGPAVTPEPFRSFVETGTLFGHTALHAASWFEKVFTIELSKELHALFAPVAAGQPNLTSLQGSSGDVLGPLLAQVPGPAVFYLDAHWSGDTTTDWAASQFKGYPRATAYGADAVPGASPTLTPTLAPTLTPTPAAQKPVAREIEAILTRYPHPALVILDDWNSFGVAAGAFAGMDWSHIPQQTLCARFDAAPRTLFHRPLGAERYIIGLSALDDSRA